MGRILVAIFGFLILIVAIIVGKNMFMPDYKNSEISAQIPTPTPQNEKTTNIVDFNVIDQLLSKQISLSCEVNKNGQSVKAYIKNGSVRANIIQSNEEQNIVVRNKKIYFWNNSIAAVINEPTKLSSIPFIASQEQNILDLAKNYQSYCKEEQINDSVFVLPNNRKFTDYSALVN